MVFVVYSHAFQVLTTITRLNTVKNSIESRCSHGILINGGRVMGGRDGAIL
jgi:hypothetical protein